MSAPPNELVEEPAAAGEVLQPIPDTSLSEDQRQRFRRLLHAIDRLKNFRGDEAATEAAYARLRRRIKRAVTAHPILARAIFKAPNCPWSLLSAVCKKNFLTFSQPVLRFLIKQNPHALVWIWNYRWGSGSSSPLRSIASTQCALMPWIAKHHAWVLDRPDFEGRPPHLKLIGVRANTGSRCHPLVIRRFYELYPQGLTQDERRTGNLPIHRCFVGWNGRETGEADLVKWMAQQNPDSMSHQDLRGFTPLHYACQKLGSRRWTDNMAEICRFLIAECPESVRMTTSDGCLPIHFLTKLFNLPAARQLQIALLREFPESIDTPAVNIDERYPSPRSVPFLQRVEPLLREEHLLKEDVHFLAEISSAWSEAARYGSNLESSASEVFQKWATLRSEALIPRRLAKIQELLVAACSEYEEDDPDDSEEDDPEDSDDDEIIFEEPMHEYDEYTDVEDMSDSDVGEAGEDGSDDEEEGVDDW